MVATVLNAVISHGSGFIGRLRDYPMDASTQEEQEAEVNGSGSNGGGERKKRKKDVSLAASGNASSSNQPTSSSSWSTAVRSLLHMCVELANMLDDVDTLHSNNQTTVAPSSSSSHRASSHISSSSFSAALHLAKHRLWLLHAAVVVLPLSSSSSSSSSQRSRSQSLHPINMDVKTTCEWLTTAADALSSRYKGSRVSGGGGGTTNVPRLDRETTNTHHSLEVI